MSFGFGVGDFVQLGQLAWTVYKSCKDAPESFGNISQEVLSLHAVLREVDESITGHDLTQTQETGLKTVGNGCHNVLTDLETLVNKYESLGTQSKRTWDRMGWGFQSVAELRSRLTSNTVLLTAFMSTAQIAVEKRLNKFLKEFKEGKHEGSVVTNQTVDSLTADEKQTWRMIRKELEGIGITIAAFDANKGFILQWFQAAMQAGAFEEQSHIQDGLGSEADTLPEILVSSAKPPLSLSSVDFPSNAALVEAEKSDDDTMRRSPNQQAPAETSPANTRPKRGSTMTDMLFRMFSYTAPAEYRLQAKYMLQGAQRGDLGAVRSALERGVSVDLRNHAGNGNTPLNIAAANGDEAIVKLLLENLADTNLPNHDGNTPLHLAAKLPRVVIAELLINSGAHIMAANQYGKTPLHTAARYGQHSVADLLLFHGSDIEAIAKDGLTPLLEAATRGQTSMMGLLLNKGADITVITDDGDSVLHLAVFTRNLACFELLVNSRAVVDKKNKRGQTPLYTVIVDKVNSHLSDIDEEITIAIANILLNKGADIMTTIHLKSMTLLHWASRYRQVHLVKYLLSRGANINAKGHGRTVLYEQVANWGDRSIIEVLLKAGADVNARAPDGSTVLHLTARQWHTDFGSLFINAGADCDAKTNDGETVLNIAMKRSWADDHHQAQFLALLKPGMPELLYGVERPPYKRTKIFEGFDFQV